MVKKIFQRRLVEWKKQYLSQGGRLTLLKSKLFSLPIYFMSLVVISRQMSLSLEKISPPLTRHSSINGVRDLL